MDFTKMKKILKINFSSYNNICYFYGFIISFASLLYLSQLSLQEKTLLAMYKRVIKGIIMSPQNFSTTQTTASPTCCNRCMAENLWRLQNFSHQKLLIHDANWVVKRCLYSIAKKGICVLEDKGIRLSATQKMCHQRQF